MSTSVNKKASFETNELSEEQLQGILKERYGISKDEFRKSIKNSSDANNSRVFDDNVVNRIFKIIICVVALAALLLFIAMNSSSYNDYGGSSSSTGKTDWNAYCRDMFPDNDEYSRSAREGCINGAKTTDNLIDGKYNK